MKKILSMMSSVLALAAIPTVAAADTFVEFFPDVGNDCVGLFGSPFAACAIPEDIDPNKSPVIAKFNTDGTGWQINTGLFPTVTADDFVLTYTGDGGTGTWTYSPEAGDPLVTFYVAKASNGFNLFKNDDAFLNAGSWFTPLNNNEGFRGLSHITFYDTGRVPGTEVPEPATALLAGLALLGLVASRKRRQA